MNKPVALADTARALAAIFAENAAAHDRDASFPFGSFEALREAGLLALTVPADLGGGGAGLVEAMGVVNRVAQGEPSTALVLAMHYIQHAKIAKGKIAKGKWPRHLAERLGREAVEGLSLINALRVEPELGTPARGGLPLTIARRDGERWRISGHKIYSTGIPILRWLAVWARTDGAEPRVGTFLVPRAAAGIRVVESWDQLGMRASGSHEVILEDVEVPLDHAVDVRCPGEWIDPDDDGFAWSSLIVSSLYDGVARAARDWFVAFLNRRKPANLGAPLASLPRFQDAAGEIEALLAVNARLLRDAAREADEGAAPSHVDSGLVKLAATRNAIAAVERAVELTGNPGLSRANPLERHLRDVLCARIHTPQDDSVRVAAGRRALGLG